MYDSLMRRTGHTFSDGALLARAMTHRSAGGDHNERLEFLGDAIINFIVAAELYRRYPAAREGELSRLRATLVNRDALGELAQHFDLGRFLHLGAGELRSGGAMRVSILSCAMEALAGAIYLDAGFAVAEKVILGWYQALLAGLPEKASVLKDPKTRLQEFLQQKGRPLPVYTVTATEGEVHQQTFIVRCVVDGREVFARGSSRRRAEQAAASAMLEICFDE